MRREIEKLEATEAKDKSRSIFTEILRARQRSELLKVPTLVDMAKDAVEDGMSVVIILNYTDSIHAAARRLRTHCTITGEDKMEDRQWVIDHFNEDDVRLIVINIMAGGTGVSLQGRKNGRPRLALISPTYSAIDLKQAFGRVHRAGGARSIQKLVFAADTVEETACAKVRRKIRNIETLNDGDLAYDGY
jgi:superfamily II DNA or RNA helicase